MHSFMINYSQLSNIYVELQPLVSMENTYASIADYYNHFRLYTVIVCYPTNWSLSLSVLLLCVYGGEDSGVGTVVSVWLRGRRGNEIFYIQEHYRPQITDNEIICHLICSQLILDISGSMSGSRFMGSLICPSCGQLCFVCSIKCEINKCEINKCEIN